jgi:DNA-directed RNA polymerase specialized sigma24 family protein
MRRPNYSDDEVRAMVEGYRELREIADTTPGRLRYVLSLADLDRALALLPERLWAVVLLHGILGFPQTTVADLLEVSQQAVSKRYRYALEDLLFEINGGVEWPAPTLS